MTIASTTVPTGVVTGRSNGTITTATVLSLPRQRRRRRGPGGLTRREMEVLRLVASGATNRAVARTLWVTDQTVKFHLSNIYRKLDVGNRFEAARWAWDNGILDAGCTDDLLCLELAPRKTA